MPTFINRSRVFYPVALNLINAKGLPRLAQQKTTFGIKFRQINTLTKSACGDFEDIKSNMNTGQRREMSTVLYKSDLSPPARAVIMILDVLGVTVETEDLNPVLREQDEPEFVQKNPMRTIPILQEGDYNLADSHAIIVYLMEKYGKAEHAQLYPKDIRKRATIHQRMFLNCGILFPRLRAIMAPTYKGRLTELNRYMIENVEDAYRMLEDYLSQSVFIADDRLTVADFSVVTTTSTLNHVHPVDGKRFPKLKKWLQTMSEIEVIKRINGPAAEMHALSIKMFMDSNRERQKAKL